MRLAVAPDDDLVALVRSRPAGETLTILLEHGRDPIALATARAVLAPLAMERAPHARLNMVVERADADQAAVEAAIRFLDAAQSTTGQLLDVG